MAAVTYASSLLNGIMGLTMISQNISRGMASWRRLSEILGSKPGHENRQRQLLAIARAFVEGSEILILNEATSNVDTRTEKAIQDAMRRIMRSRTSLVIEHRLSTIRDSDLIVVMDHGKIVESGNHVSLLKQKGKYYELYMTQYAGFAT